MAKKSRRARSHVAQAAQPIRVSQPPRLPSTAAAPKEVDFSKEYHYVIEDLKRIAIIASALLVLLIALAIAIG
jgi:hypothetical protein